LTPTVVADAADLGLEGVQRRGTHWCPDAAVLDGAEECLHLGEGLDVEPIVTFPAMVLAVNQSGLRQQPEVATDGRTRDAPPGRQVDHSEGSGDELT